MIKKYFLKSHVMMILILIIIITQKIHHETDISYIHI